MLCAGEYPSPTETDNKHVNTLIHTDHTKSLEGNKRDAGRQWEWKGGSNLVRILKEGFSRKPVLKLIYLKDETARKMPHVSKTLVSEVPKGFQGGSSQVGKEGGGEFQEAV